MIVEEAAKAALNLVSPAAIGAGSIALVEIASPEDTVPDPSTDVTVSCPDTYEFFVDTKSQLDAAGTAYSDWPSYAVTAEETVEACLVDTKEDAEND